MGFHSSKLEHSFELQIPGRIALYKGSVIFVCPLPPKLFVPFPLPMSWCCTKFEPQWPSQQSTINSQSFCLADDLVKEVQASLVQMSCKLVYRLTLVYD